MKTLPSTTVGCPYADDVHGSPNAHFSSSLATAAGEKPWRRKSSVGPDSLGPRPPAAFAVWNRLFFVMSGLHPFQDGADRFVTGGCVGHTFDMVSAPPRSVEPNRLPLTHSAIATRCTSVRFAASAWVRMLPVVIDSYSFSGVSCLSM